VSKQPPSLKARALGLLARREHSRRELHDKLLPHAGSAEELEALLEEFQAKGWLSEKRYVEQLAHARQGRHGSLRLAHELKQKGVPDALIEEALPDIRASDMEAARDVWRRKFGQLPANAQERARQMRFLHSRGFPAEVIRKVLGGLEDEAL
jgi:regulatory protein